MEKGAGLGGSSGARSWFQHAKNASVDRCCKYFTRRARRWLSRSFAVFSIHQLLCEHPHYDMARAAAVSAEQSDFEKQRLANIAERDALLKKLTQEAAATGLYSKPASAGAPNGTKRSRKSGGPPAKRVKKEEDVGPRRTSSRIAGIQADSEVAKEKAEEEYVQQKEADRQRRMRKTEDLNFAG